MLKQIKKGLTKLGVNTKYLVERFNVWSLHAAASENNFTSLIKELRNIEPDISDQYSRAKKHLITIVS